MKSVLSLTPDTIAELAKSGVGIDLDEIPTLSAQKADAMTGFGLIGFGFVIEIMNLVFVRRPISFDKSFCVGVGFAAAMAATVIFYGFAWNSEARIYYERETKCSVVKDLLGKILKAEPEKRKNLLTAYLPLVEQYVEQLTGIKKGKNETDEAYFFGMAEKFRCGEVC